MLILIFSLKPVSIELTVLLIIFVYGLDKRIMVWPSLIQSSWCTCRGYRILMMCECCEPFWIILRTFKLIRQCQPAYTSRLLANDKMNDRVSELTFGGTFLALSCAFTLCAVA